VNQTNHKKLFSGCTIAIIGGGFTGTTLAAHLLRRADASISVVLIERGASLGRGVAYATQCVGHLLNVPVENMSAFADDPLHFLRWAHCNFDDGVRPFDFLPRRVYGEYVESVLREEIRLHPGLFEWKHDEACSITRINNTAEILLRSGEVIGADRVVLAIGNFPPSDPQLPGKGHRCRRYIADAWAEDALENLGNVRCILLVGSGLTSVDVAVALRARQFKGAIHILSRHGLLPKGHKMPASRTPIRGVASFPRTTLELMRAVRTHIQAAEMQGRDWRSVIDSLRPVAQQIWLSLPRKEQRRFLRHVRPYWEAHRHRLAPEIDALLASQMSSGQIQIHGGRITAYHENADGVEITYRDRKSGKLESLLVDRVFNCTGPEVDCRKVDDPFLKNLLRQKLARPDSLFLGLEVSDEGALIDGDGRVSDFLYAVGPLRKGSLWETTAVPEIRDQISKLTGLLVSSCEQKNSALPDLEQAAVTSGALVELRR
jgi:uncharacterized NAD(P)/FAD-binding protein YdhS